MERNGKLNGAEIRIYQSVWRNALLVACCLIVVIVGFINLRYGKSHPVMGKTLDWLVVVLFGGGALFITVTTLHNRIRHIPFLIIYDDRLELYKQITGSYETVNFADVQEFRLFKINSAKMIAIDYKEDPLIHKVEESSAVKQKLMEFNFRVAGAIEAIPCTNLTMKGEEICELLNSSL